MILYVKVDYICGAYFTLLSRIVSPFVLLLMCCILGATEEEEPRIEIKYSFTWKWPREQGTWLHCGKVVLRRWFGWTGPQTPPLLDTLPALDHS